MFRDFVVAFALFATTAPANSAIISKTFAFTSSDFRRQGVTNEALTLNGSYSVVFDNTSSIENSTDGLVKNSLNYSLASGFGGPDKYTYLADQDRLIISADAHSELPSYYLTDNDWFISIGQVSSNPYIADIGVTTAQGFQHFSYSYNLAASNYVGGSEPGGPGGNPAPVPEPALLGLFGLGAIGLGLTRRRRTV